MKRCPGCTQWLKTEQFWPNRSKADGLQVWCKGCMRGWRFSYREVELEQERLRRLPKLVVKAASVRVPGTEAGTVTSS